MKRTFLLGSGRAIQRYADRLETANQRLLELREELWVLGKQLRFYMGEIVGESGFYSVGQAKAALDRIRAKRERLLREIEEIKRGL